MQTRITSVRSIPSSFDSSSGVRWFAILAPSPSIKKPAALYGADGLPTKPLVSRQESEVLPPRTIHHVEE